MDNMANSSPAAAETAAAATRLQAVHRGKAARAHVGDKRAQKMEEMAMKQAQMLAPKIISPRHSPAILEREGAYQAPSRDQPAAAIKPRPRTAHR